MPTFAQVGLLKRLTGLIYFPVTPLFPHFGLLGASLPAGQVQAALPRARPHRPDRRTRDPGLVQDVADDIRARIQDELVDMLGAAPVGLDRMSAQAAASSSPALSTYWGGRLAQALERDPDTEVIVGVSPGDPTCELTRTEYVRVGTQHALLDADRQRGGRSTP